MTLDSLNNLNLVPRSMILVAVQMLLAHFQVKSVVDSVAKGTNVSEIYNVIGSRGAKKRLIIPFISREHWLSLLSILEWINPPAPAHWMINGQAARGSRQVQLFGDSGKCGIVWSKDILQAYYAMNQTVMLTEEEKIRRVASLPDRPELKIDSKRIALPAPAVCDRILSAIQGKPVSVTASEYQEVLPVIVAGLRLTATEHADKSMLLCRSDSVEAAVKPEIELLPA